MLLSEGFTSDIPSTSSITKDKMFSSNIYTKIEQKEFSSNLFFSTITCARSLALMHAHVDACVPQFIAFLRFVFCFSLSLSLYVANEEQALNHIFPSITFAFG